MLTDFARDYVRPDAVVWDVGANVGLFTFAAAGLAGPSGVVVAVEADLALALRLRRAAAWNQGAGQVAVVAAAVSEKSGIARFSVANTNAAVNHLASVAGSSVTGGIRGEHSVATVTLDSLLEHHPPPNVLKIDVEGAELLALTGAGNVLDGRPVVLCEIGSQNWPAVRAIFRDRGYSILDAVSREPADTASYNIIGLPGSSS